MGRPGLISLFEAVALTPCCRYKVRNCLLTRVRWGEALGTDLPEQWGLHPLLAVRQCGVGSKHFHGDPEVTGMQSARGGFTGVTEEETNTSREITPTRSTSSGLTVWGYGSSCQGNCDCRLVTVPLQSGRGETQYWFPAGSLLSIQAGNLRPWDSAPHSWGAPHTHTLIKRL